MAKKISPMELDFKEKSRKICENFPYIIEVVKCMEGEQQFQNVRENYKDQIDQFCSAYILSVLENEDFEENRDHIAPIATYLGLSEKYRGIIGPNLRLKAYLLDSGHPDDKDLDKHSESLRRNVRRWLESISVNIELYWDGKGRKLMLYETVVKDLSRLLWLLDNLEYASLAPDEQEKIRQKSLESPQLQVPPVLPSSDQRSVGVDPAEQDKEYPVEYYNLPMSNDWFTGRENELEAIDDNFADGCRIQILYGIGGIGKSQIALKYAYDHYRSYSLIHWINAHTIDSIVECYRAFLAEKQALPNVQTKEGICQSYTKYMDSHPDWLIIYDNGDYYTDKEYSDFSNLCLPKNRSVGHILITSRNKRPIGKAKRIQIDVLPDADAVSFLLQRTESDDTDGAEQLASRLGRLPLALEIAGAYIHATPGCDFQTYMVYLGQETKILDQMVEVTDYNETIKDILLLTIKRIKKDRNSDKISRCVEVVLHLCAYGAPYNIDLRVFAYLPLDKFNGIFNSELNVDKPSIRAIKSICAGIQKRNGLIRTMITYGLVTEQPDGFLSIHEIQMEILRDYVYPQADWSCLVDSALNYYFMNTIDNSDIAIQLHFYQHKAYIAKFREISARLSSTSNAEHYALQYRARLVSLSIHEFIARLKDNPVLSVAEFNKSTDSIMLAVQEMLNAYIAIDELDHPSIDDLNFALGPLLLAIHFFATFGCYNLSVNMIASTFPALHITFKRCEKNIEIINVFKSAGWKKLVQETRKCLPPALLEKPGCSKSSAISLMYFREWVNAYAKIACWDKNKLTEYLMIIDAYIKNDPSILPQKAMEEAKRRKPPCFILRED